MYAPLNQDINRLIFERDRIKGEVALLLKERDSIREEIAEQRRWKTVITLEAATLWDVKFLLEEQSLILSRINWKTYSDFLANYSRQEAHLKTIEARILVKEAELSKFSDLKAIIQSQEVIIDSQEREIKDKVSELNGLWDERIKTKKEVEDERKKINKEIDKNQKLLDDIMEEKQTLLKLRSELEMKEKRYLKLTSKQDVKSRFKK